MPLSNITIILTALALFFASSIILYMTWYVIYGRKAKKRKAVPKTKETTDDRNKKWGVEKDSYCYPSINDVMGFEFVKVVKLDQQEQPQPEKTEEKRPSWEQSQGQGLITVSSKETQQERDEDEPFPEEDNWLNRRKRMAMEQEEKAWPKPKENRETEDTSTPFTDEGAEQEAIFTMEEIHHAGAFGEWENRTNSIMDDEELERLLDRNADLIEKPSMDDEQTQTAKMIEEFRKLYGTIEKESNDLEINTLMEAVYEGGEEEEAENKDVDYIEDEIDENNMQTDSDEEI